MKHIKIYLQIVILAIIFAGCNDDANTQLNGLSTEVNDGIVVNALDGDIADCDSTVGWTTVLSGANISAHPETQLKFDQEGDNTKKVCVETGYASVSY